MIQERAMHDLCLDLFSQKCHKNKTMANKTKLGGYVTVQNALKVAD